MTTPGSAQVPDPAANDPAAPGPAAPDPAAPDPAANEATGLHVHADAAGLHADGDAAGLPVRRAARVILLDPEDRVLLMRYDDRPPNGSHWATPGGGLNPDEDYPEAAIRELAEETGWTDIALLGEVHRRSHVMKYASWMIRQYERIYLARTDQSSRPIAGVDAMHAADGIAAWHWWTIAELDTTAETVWPAELAELIRSATQDGIL